MVIEPLLFLVAILVHVVSWFFMSYLGIFGVLMAIEPFIIILRILVHVVLLLLYVRIFDILMAFE